MNGRWFDERQLQAYVADGSEKFRKSDERKVELVDGVDAGAAGTAAGEGERLDRFGEWLEEEDDDANESDAQ
jgi:HIV Tat-specific factor 1